MLIAISYFLYYLSNLNYIHTFFFLFLFFVLLVFSPPHTYPSSLFFLLFLFLLDSRTLSTVIRNREIKNKRLLAPLLIEGHRQALSLFCSTVGCLLASPWVRWLLSLTFFFLVMIWLILRLCFWVCILIMLEFRDV